MVHMEGSDRPSGPPPRARSCVFCGASGSLTKEHVFGRWLGELGLSEDLVQQVAGPLNGLGRRMGESPPFRTTVRDVCASCNNGWMSVLEGSAQRALTPLIRGQMSHIDAGDRVAVSLWAHKTALVSMLISSDAERRRGHGLPREEYRAFRVSALRGELLPRTTAWVGRYAGEWRLGATRVVPVIVRFPGLPDPETPDGYVFTVVVGELLIQGLRFTSHTPAVARREGGRYLVPLSPSRDARAAVTLTPITEEEFLALAAGGDLALQTPGVSVAPWRPASDLPDSRPRGALVELPLMCGRHVAFYPALLVAAAQKGRFCWFMTSCDCGVAYLIHTEAAGAHAKEAEAPAEIAAIYEALPGRELELASSAGRFFYKEDIQGASFRRR